MNLDNAKTALKYARIGLLLATTVVAVVEVVKENKK